MEKGEKTLKPLMIVEDNPDDIFFIKRAFLKLNVDNPLLFLRDGEQAIEYLSGAGDFNDRGKYPLPFLILLDIKLPGISGFEVLRWLRSRKTEISLIPVIMLTSSSHPSDINKAYRFGANSYITKPTKPEELVNLVNTIHVYWAYLNKPPEIMEYSNEGKA
ncbi:MAG: response regulator [Candidatus Aminicenantes bacterium]|nr:response regulator [Candidatus Aminicenantes bacterium]